MASHYNCARRYDQALDEARKTLELDPNRWEAHMQIWRAYLGKGMLEEALEAVKKVRGSGDDESAVSPAALALTYAYAGRVKEARKMLAKANREKEPLRCARAYATLGDLDEAFAALDKAYEQHSSNMLWVQADRGWDSLRSDPRFPALLRRMNFPP